MTVMGYHHFHDTVSKYYATFHLLTINLEKHLVLQGTHLQLVFDPLVPTMAFLLSLYCLSIQVQNSYPSLFQFLLQQAYPPVTELY